MPFLLARLGQLRTSDGRARRRRRWNSVGIHPCQRRLLSSDLRRSVINCFMSSNLILITSIAGPRCTIGLHQGIRRGVEMNGNATGHRWPPPATIARSAGDVDHLMDNQQHPMRTRRLGINTHEEPVVYLREDSAVCRAEGFEARNRIDVRVDDQTVTATLNMVTGDLLRTDEVGLSDAAWERLMPAAESRIHFAHPLPLDSMRSVRAKMYGRSLESAQLRAIIRDVVARRFSDVELAAFVTACAGSRLDVHETLGLTRAMVDVGSQLDWNRNLVADKHSVGGLPGNRTTMIVVPIVTALGLMMPKTSSRAITSPSGTADTMETLAPVVLSLEAMRRVVSREGGCIVWGGAVGLSPADDLLIRIERALDIDSIGQLVASVLSKKVAAGATHVVFDIPVGETAKVRDPLTASIVISHLEQIGAALGLHARCVVTDGSQPVGRGIGPVLEALDVLAVLRGEPGAPADLRERSLALAAAVLETVGVAQGSAAMAMVEQVLLDGRAWTKFQALCDAQGGMRELRTAAHRHDVVSQREGRVRTIDNRLLARAAKLAGAPHAAAAGVAIHVRIGDPVDAGAPLFSVHAESRGELAYALEFVDSHPDIVNIEQVA
jgi:thymidine phosphorylase